MYISSSRIYDGDISGTFILFFLILKCLYFLRQLHMTLINRKSNKAILNDIFLTHNAIPSSFIIDTVLWNRVDPSFVIFLFLFCPNNST